MARGRHIRRTGLLVWLFTTSVEPSRRPWRDVHAHSLVLLHDSVHTLQSEVAGLRGVQQQATTAEAASQRRTARLEQQLAAAQVEIAELRGELRALREELVWAFAERRHGELVPSALAAPAPASPAVASPGGPAVRAVAG